MRSWPRRRFSARPESIAEALEVARQAVSVSPRSAPAHFALGRVYVAMSRDDDAKPAFIEALKLNPTLAPAELELSKIHLRARQLDDAEKFAQAAIAKVPNFAEPRILIAQINVRQRNLAKADPAVRMLAKALPRTRPC